MIIDGYVVPDDLEIEEFTTKKGTTFYACGSTIALSKAGVLFHFATARICEQCGKMTQGPYRLLCPACMQKKAREKYLSIPTVPFTAQPVFVGDDFTTDLEQYLIDQLDDCSLDEILTFEIMEAAPMEIPEFSMGDFLEDYLCEDAGCYSGYDKAINALIKDAADPVFTYGKNRVEIPEWLAKKLKEAADEES